MEIRAMQTRYQQGETLNIRSRHALSVSSKGYLDFELTQSQVQAIQQCLPQTFFMINPHNGDLDRLKKTMIEGFFANENPNARLSILPLKDKQKISDPIQKQKQMQSKKRKKKQELQKNVETQKSEQGQKRQIIKNKAMEKKKSLKVIEENLELAKEQNSQRGSNYGRIQVEENQKQQQGFKEPQLHIKLISGQKQIHMRYQNVIHSEFQVHPQNDMLEIIQGEHYFQYRPIRPLSSGLPRFIPPQENEQRQSLPQTETNTLKYLFGLPITTIKQESFPKLNEKQKNFCYNILHKLKAHRSSLGFRVPVDPLIQGIPDYFNVIYNPMDLQTITKKVMKDKYKDIYQFHADINKIFMNSYKYNPRQTIYFEAAIDFEDYYHFLLHDAEQRPEAYSKQALIKNSKIKKVENFGEFEFTEPTLQKKNSKKDSLTKMKKTKSVDKHKNNLHSVIMQDEYKSFDSGNMEQINPQKSSDLENELKRGQTNRMTNKQESIEEANQQSIEQHNYEYHPGLMYMHHDINEHPHKKQQQPSLNQTNQFCNLIYPQYYHHQIPYPMGIIQNQNIYHNTQHLRNQNLLKNKKHRNISSANNDDYNDDDFNIFQEQKNSKKDILRQNEVQSQFMKQELSISQKQNKQKFNQTPHHQIMPKIKKQQEKGNNKKFSEQLMSNNGSIIKINIKNSHPEDEQSIIVNNINPNFACETNNFEVILQPNTGPCIGSNIGPIISSKKIINRAPKQKKKFKFFLHRQSSQDEQFLESSRKSKTSKNREKIKKTQSSLENSSVRIPKRRGRHPKNKGSITEGIQEEAAIIFGSQNQRLSHTLLSELSYDPRKKSVKDSENIESLEQSVKNKDEKGRNMQKESKPQDIFIGDSSRQVQSAEIHQVNFDEII